MDVELQCPTVFDDQYLVVFLPLHTGPAATKAGQHQPTVPHHLDQLATGLVRLEPRRPDNDVDWGLAPAVDDGPIAWLLARSPVIVPIPGTSSVAHLDENV